MELEQQNSGPRAKRTKVTLACERCKKRKQKCNGEQPCSKCEARNLSCEYIVPQRPMPFGKNHYIESLERRVADLETLLAANGINDYTNDHWKGNASNVDINQAVGVELSPEGPQQSTSPTSNPVEDNVIEWQEGIDPVASVLRSLSLEVNGSGYIGASSHVALGRLFSFLSSSKVFKGHSAMHSIPAHIGARGDTSSFEDPINLSDVPVDVADRLFSGYLKHIATRFPVVHSVWIKNLHDRRQYLSEIFEKSTLHLIYAAAGRFLETTGESGDFAIRRHYEAALRSLDVIMNYNDVRTIQVLMLMAVYCLRDQIGAGAWTYSRTALLIAIDHGLHRQTKSMSQVTLENELKKRLFWTCYSFDRQISIPMGRPFGISDRDIDLEIPLDINEDSTEKSLSCWEPPQIPVQKSTTLSSFIRLIALRKIESEIQQAIYRVDRTAPVDNQVIEQFLERLQAWRDSIPGDTKRFKDMDAVPYDGYDYYLVFYYKCQRLLLYPSITKIHVELRFLKECAKACAGVCGAYKRLHQSLDVGYSSMAVQTVFMAGLTMVYCIWRSPDDIFDMMTSNGIHDCSAVLFAIAERVASVKKYRNAFEAIRQGVIDRIAEAPRPRLRDSIVALEEELRPQSSDNDCMLFDDGSYEEFSYIMADMTGEDWSVGMNECHPQQNYFAVNEELGSSFGLSGF